MLTFEKIWAAVLPFLKMALILAAGHFIIVYLIKLIDRGFGKSKLDPSLAKFLLKTIKIALYILVITAALNAIGISTTGLVAVMSAAAVAVVVAMRDSLGNVAGGILLLISPRFSTGDYISVDADEGTVLSVDLLHTTIVTFDKRQISLPNGALLNSRITNYTREKTRRVDLEFPIPYDTDTDAAKRAALEAVQKNALALKEPEPFIRVKSYGDSAVILAVRAWCKTEDYWTVYFDLTEQVRVEFDKNDIRIPFNQLDVHIKEK